MIRNLTKLNSEACKRILTCQSYSPLFNNPIYYEYRSNKHNQEGDSFKEELIKEASLLKEDKQYVEDMARRHHSYSGPFYKKMTLINRIVRTFQNSLISKEQEVESFFQKMYKKISKKFSFSSFVCFAIISTLLQLVTDKREKDWKDKQEKKTLDNIESFVGSIDESTLLQMKKITIIEKRKKEASESQQDETSQDEKDKFPHKITYYRIVMEEENGQKHIAEPYVGDPNNFLKYLENIQKKNNVSKNIEVIFEHGGKYQLNDAISETFGFFTPFLPILITVWIFRKTDPTSFLKNMGKTAKEFKIEAMKDIKTRFDDVAGMEQAKKEITEFVDFLKNNEKYRQMGAKIPKGALLTGPPGTGKTMLARACAGEAGVSFFYISGSEFVEIFVGLGASKVRDLFASARQNAPSIIFIDEIDAIGKKRENSRNEEKDSTLNQLLVEMDGFSSHETIVVLAATNRKEILDNALTRPGRFDRMVEVSLPDVKAREEIFMVHLAPLKVDPNVELRIIAKRLSELSPGFSGADIANLCNEAAIIATRKDRAFITDKDFEEATERITAGYIKKNLMKEKSRKRVAYHEAGHAVSSWFLRGGDPLVKLTIIPRSKGALGYAQYLPKATFIMERSELIDKVAIMLGGITSEEIFFGDMSSGGSDDLQKVYSLTRRMVTQFGMGKSTYNLTLDEESYVQKESNFLTDKMEEEIESILLEARKRSKEIIEAKKDIIEALAQELLLKETLNKDEILKTMGERPDFENVVIDSVGKEKKILI